MKTSGPLGWGGGPMRQPADAVSVALACAAMVTAAAVPSTVRRVSLASFGSGSRCILFPMLLCGIHEIMPVHPVYLNPPIRTIPRIYRSILTTVETLRLGHPGHATT